jgi:DNA-binding FrmR family transcriptional regulator
MAANQQQLLNRLKTVEGHIRGVQRMVEQDAYCIDIIAQTQAVQRALDAFNSAILAEHLNGCVATAIRSEDTAERERVVSELLSVFQKNRELRGE